jgi:hypothetical protein
VDGLREVIGLFQTLLEGWSQIADGREAGVTPQPREIVKLSRDESNAAGPIGSTPTSRPEPWAAGSPTLETRQRTAPLALVG